MSQSKQQSEIEELENAFWKSIVDGDPKVATAMLHEPALMVSSHGVNKFNHADYTKMAKDGAYKLLNYKFTKMDVVCPTQEAAIATYHVHQVMEMKGKKMEMDSIGSTTWLKINEKWECIIHTESLVDPKSA
jgi:ketosteroid isomerase-like protein